MKACVSRVKAFHRLAEQSQRCHGLCSLSRLSFSPTKLKGVMWPSSSPKVVLSKLMVVGLGGSGYRKTIIGLTLSGVLRAETPTHLRRGALNLVVAMASCCIAL